MKKKADYTPNSRIKSALRKLFLRSRERAFAMKHDKYTCQVCGKKQSKAKGKEINVECDHIEGITNWQELYKIMREHLLCHPSKLQVKCHDCHKEKTNEEREERGK